MARYRAGIERTVRANPQKPRRKFGTSSCCSRTAKCRKPLSRRHIIELKPSVSLLSDASTALLAARQYGLAKEFLEKTTKEMPAAS